MSERGRGADVLVFFCNGKKIVDEHVDPGMSLVFYLRIKFTVLLTGSKPGCGEGGCGSCTVMLSKYSPREKTIRHVAVNACLTPICLVHGMAVTTVEGIGNTETRLHPVQERLAKAHGTQCGFCSPGIVMSMYALLRNKPQPTMEEIESAFEGNVCRCTGYRPILQGYSTFTKEGCCGGMSNGNCCMDKYSNGVSAEGDGIATSLFDASEFAPYDPSQEPIFPPELMIMLNENPPTLHTFKSDHVTWFRPVKLEQLLELKDHNPRSVMVAGNTRVGIEVRYKNQEYPVRIDVNSIGELTRIETTSTGVRVGAAVSLTSLNDYLKTLVQQLPEYKTRFLAAIVEMLRWFAGHQVRNVACLGGSIATCRPTSDLKPLLMAASCKVELISKRGTRKVTMDGHFFTGYKTSIIKDDEVILAINIPFTSENEYLYGYKQSLRRVDDVATVNAGMRVVFKQGTNVVEDCTLAFGGMAATTVLATKTMASINGRAWSDGLVEAMCPLLADDLPLPPGAPGGMETYRQSLTLSLFFKFYLAILQQINLKMPGISDTTFPTHHLTANQPYKRDPMKSVQIYQEVPNGQPDSDGVGRPLTHQSAFKQVTGEAIFANDIPPAINELYLGMVLSEKAHANILSVDPTAALAVKGVHSFVDASDVPGANYVGQWKDDILYADVKVVCVGQVIGVIVADDQFIAKRAAKLVKVDYEELPAIITIEDAMEHDSFYPEEMTLKIGDLDEGFASSDHILEGETRSGAQEHFYLETHTILVTPGEGGELEVIVTSQWPSRPQELVAQALGIPSHKVVTRVKRIGGGFGGKSTKSALYAAMCAVAAKKVNCPVRLMLDRHEDMTTTGTRHPFLGRYKVGFTNTGQLRALQIDLYSNAGSSHDDSVSVMTVSLSRLTNSYNFHNVRLSGHLCKTNIATNTAFRGFGTPQSMFVTEHIMHEIALKCGLSQTKVREINFYQDGDKWHTGQEVMNSTIERCWNQCLAKSDYEKRMRDVDQYNSENRWRKRGLAAVPVSSGISLDLELNQAGALVNIYTDGSVLIAHGGIEMGQGLHTKMIQVASRTLRIPQEKIHISETSTQTVPNTSPTAGSISSDLNGMAIKNACETLLHRLEPFMHENPKGSWESWVMEAYKNRVSLSCTGFYQISGLSYANKPFHYFVHGAGVTEVEIDCLTGDHQLLRVDIVMDTGDSLNPAVDIGQIEGAFIQGYGFYALEDYRMSPSGQLLTLGPRHYKVPTSGNIPSQFNVSLLTRSSNPLAIYSSKAVGEPPLMLALSAFFAIKNAIGSAREDAGILGSFRLDVPATAERIRMACHDQFTQQFPEPERGTFTPSFVRP